MRIPEFDNAEIRFWVCPDCASSGVDWDGGMATCRDCGATNNNEDVLCTQCGELASLNMADETCDACHEPMCFSCYEKFSGFCEACHDEESIQAIQ